MGSLESVVVAIIPVRLPDYQVTSENNTKAKEGMTGECARGRDDNAH